MIDIVTLTMNNPCELNDTVNSLSQSISEISNIYVIYDGCKPILKKEFIEICVLKKIVIIKGPGKGIYPAMNCALNYVKNNFIFINSGDKLIGNPLHEVKGLNVPLSISCNIVLNDGEIIKFTPNKRLKKFNHNSIIFPRDFKIKYDVAYEIAADFDICLKMEREFGWPTQVVTNGYLQYNINGISSLKKKTRDYEYLKVSLKNYKYFISLWYLIKYFINYLRGYD